MTLEYLNKLILAQDIEKTITTLDTYFLVKSIKEALDQYYPSKHEITDKVKRPDKLLVDEKGNSIGTTYVARLSLPFQKKIVQTAAAFLGTPSTEASPEDDNQSNLLEITKKVLTDNKIDYKFKNIAKITMSEKQCAELWYTQNTDASYWEGFPIRQTAKSKLRVRILAKSKGDDLYPVFDSYGDMIAFGRAYEIKEVTETGEDTVKYFDLYTAERFYYSKKTKSGTWEINSDVDILNTDPLLDYKGDGLLGIPNRIGKIPIIYYWQPHTEWEDVQPLISRLETKISNHADTNDYFDSPVLLLSGDEVTPLSGKSEQGKAFQLKGGSEAKYLTWDQAPESMKMEIENLLKFIYGFTSTPDISFENMKGLGYFSHIALKTLFLDAHMKASDKEEIFGEGVQRRLNYIKHALAVIDPAFKPALKMDIKPKFHYFLPENIYEQVDVLVKAFEAKILSRKTALSLNPLVTNAENEEKLLSNEAKNIAPPETGGGN